MGSALRSSERAVAGSGRLFELSPGSCAPNSDMLTWALQEPQMVFQDAGASLTSWLTVGELIHERVAASGLARAERKEAVERTDAVGLRHRSQTTNPVSCLADSGRGLRSPGLSSSHHQCCSATSQSSWLDMSLAATVLNLIDELRSELGMAVLLLTRQHSFSTLHLGPYCRHVFGTDCARCGSRTLSRPLLYTPIRRLWSPQ